MSNEFDFDQFKAAALKAMYAGKPLTGKDGVLAPLIENLLNAALEGEMDSHMSDEERYSGNRRNGHISKQVQSSVGELTIETPRDRESRFSPQIRRMIYTTNTVEGYHRQIRKVTKNKGIFPNDTALEKLVYLAYTRIRRKWTMPVVNWGQTAQQLAIRFNDRFSIM